MKKAFLLSLLIIISVFFNASIANAVSCVCTHGPSSEEQVYPTCSVCTLDGCGLSAPWISCRSSSGTTGGTAAPTTGGSPVGGGSTQLDNPLGDDATFPVIVNRVVTSVLGLVGVLALLAFVYGGVLWMVSRGDTAMIQKGKTMMTWAVFGIVIIFSSYAVLTFIFQAFGFGS